MASDKSPVILWFRRDLRLEDHPAVQAACEGGRPVIPVFVLDDLAETLGAAPKWRLGLGLGRFSETLSNAGSRLILRRGKALDQLRELIRDTGASAVFWTRLYDPDSIARDRDIKSALKEDGIEGRSFAGHLLFEPWTVETKEGGFYKVFTPMWKSVRQRDVAAPQAAPSTLSAPDVWPNSDDLDDWDLGAAMHRGAGVVRAHVRLGASAAQDRLDWFVEEAIGKYKAERDCPAIDATSGLSENLSLGEISPHRCWHAGQRAMDAGKPGAETFLKELVWREFAYHLMYHTPHMLTDNWREGWDSFPWNTDERLSEVKAWKKGRTGVKFVDAAMREMYVTGRMHNRGRMIVASYLTKHLMCHWRIGQKWFEECLIDWDPASNAMGWQWAAGSGPDAAPYFRVFNPVTQLDKFDPEHSYAKRWIAEGQSNPPETALDYFRAMPERWAMSAGDDYPDPIVALDAGRKAALDAYENRDF
ncbi:cryptochrome/photolyase family protein [Arenibacterium sp. CAU 1754]